MIKIAFKSPFQQHPLLFSLQVNGNRVLWMLMPKVLESSLILLFLLHPATQQILKSLPSPFIQNPATSHLPIVTILAAKSPSFVSWKITSAPTLLDPQILPTVCSPKSSQDDVLKLEVRLNLSGACYKKADFYHSS